MSVCFVVIPVVVGSWPLISAAIVSAGAAMGYRAVTQAERSIEMPIDLSISSSVSLTMPDSQVVSDTLMRGESFSLERDGVIATFRVDGRGACQVHLTGTNKTDAELEKIGAELMDRVRQQYAYAKVMQQMEERGFQVTGQEVEENNTIRIRVQRM